MKIVYLIHSLYSAGGMEMILTSKANWLCSRPDMEIWIVTSHMAGRKLYFPLDSRIHLLDVNVNERMLGGMYRKRLQEILKVIKPDVTVSLCGSDLFRMLECSDTGARIAEYHFLHEKFFMKYPHRPIYARHRTTELHSAFSKCDALVVLSDYDLKFYKDIMPEPEKVHKIGNITNPAKSKSELNQKRFLCVGRLSPEKNFVDALKVWKLVSGKYPDWHLDIYGEGRERRNLERFIRKEGLSENVSLKGSCPSIMDEYAKSSGLLVTSRYEGFGLVAIEAASCGIPVVAYSCPGGLTELVKDGRDGFLVREGDIEAAADRIIKLIENDNLRGEMGINAIEKAHDYYPESIMNQWLELFNSLKRI